MKIVTLCLALLVPHVTFAQTDVITLRTDRILDGRGGVISAGNVVIRDGVIVEIGSTTPGTVYEFGASAARTVMESVPESNRVLPMPPRSLRPLLQPYPWLSLLLCRSGPPRW